LFGFIEFGRIIAFVGAADELYLYMKNGSENTPAGYELQNI